MAHQNQNPDKTEGLQNDVKVFFCLKMICFLSKYNRAAQLKFYLALGKRNLILNFKNSKFQSKFSKSEIKCWLLRVRNERNNKYFRHYKHVFQYVLQLAHKNQSLGKTQGFQNDLKVSSAWKWFFLTKNNKGI